MTIKPPDNPVNQNTPAKTLLIGNVVDNAIRLVQDSFDISAYLQQRQEWEAGKLDSLESYMKHYDRSFDYVMERVPTDPKVLRTNSDFKQLAKLRDAKADTVWMENTGSESRPVDRKQFGKKVHCVFQILSEKDMNAPHRAEDPIVSFYGIEKALASGFYFAGIKPIPISPQWAGLALAGAIAISCSFKVKDFTTKPDIQHDAIIQAHAVQGNLLQYETGFEYLTFARDFIAQYENSRDIFKTIGAKRAIEEMDIIADWSGVEPQSVEEENLRQGFHLFTLLKAYAFNIAKKTKKTNNPRDGHAILKKTMEEEHLGGHLYVSF